jgi:hypothetical protein
MGISGWALIKKRRGFNKLTRYCLNSRNNIRGFVQILTNLLLAEPFPINTSIFKNARKKLMRFLTEMEFAMPDLL